MNRPSSKTVSFSFKSMPNKLRLLQGTLHNADTVQVVPRRLQEPTKGTYRGRLLNLAKKNDNPSAFSLHATQRHYSGHILVCYGIK